MTAHEDVIAARGGSQEAFGRLVEARWDRIVRMARAVAGDIDAEDVAQEACVVCWRKLSQLAEPSAFDSWLMRIVFTRAARRARWNRWRMSPAQSWSGKADVSSNEAPLAGAAARTDDPAGQILVWQVLSRLPARQRAVVHMTVVEGMTDTEIGESLGIKASSVRAHRRRATELIDKWWRRFGNKGGVADERASRVRRGAAPVGDAIAGNESK